MKQEITELNKQLIEAVQYNQYRKVKKLLQQGADPNTIDNTGGKNVLLDAANSWYPAMLTILLEHGADPNAANNDGKTILMHTANYGKYECVKTLIEHGADINLREKKFGFNALLFACNYVSFETVKILHEAGADIHSLANDGSNALMYAASGSSYEIVNYLIEQGFDINAGNDKGKTALMYSLKNVENNGSRNRKRNIKNKKKIFLELIKAGADLNIADKEGRTSLNYSVKEGSLKYTELLMNKGAKPDLSEENLIHTAFYAFKNKEKLKALLKKYGVKNPPFIISYKTSIICKECRKNVPLNGPFQKVKCENCLTETELSDLDLNLWDTLFEDSVHEECSHELEDCFNIDLARSNPKCSKCNAELDISDYDFGSEKPVICKKCTYQNNAFPAPDFLKEYSVYDLTAQQIFCAEKEGEEENIDEDDVKPVTIQCVSCAASLIITKDTPRNCTCEHCETIQYLPDPVWKALHPVKKRKKWYIRFA